MNLDVTRNDAAQCPYKIIHLPWVCTPHSVRNTDTVHTDFVDSLVDRQEIYKI